MTISIALAFALRSSRVEAVDAKGQAERWTRFAAKAYTGYLLAISPVKDGIIDEFVLPTGSKLQNGMVLHLTIFAPKD